jgi:hypothetical protein
MGPFEEFMHKGDVKAHQWAAIDQNVASIRAMVRHVTRLQIEHIERARARGEECHVPCSSPQVIEHINAIDYDTALMILHLLICDAAQLIASGIATGEQMPGYHPLT